MLPVGQVVMETDEMKRFFLSRTTIITVLLLSLAGVLLSALFPQRVSTSLAELQQWQQHHPVFWRWGTTVGLDHVYTTPWFAVVLCLGFISLVLSTIEQGKIALRKSLSVAGYSDGAAIQVRTPDDLLAKALVRRGYLPVCRGDILKYVRHPWGYWGNFLLHLGMTVAIAASLYIALTQNRGAANLVEGEVHTAADPWAGSDRGMLAAGPLLAVPVRLDSVRPELWPDYRVKDISSDLTFLSADNRSESRTVGVNTLLHYRGFHLYQSPDFGHAFFLEFSCRDGRKDRQILQLPFPNSLEKPGYNDFTLNLPDGTFPLKAKYLVDAEKRSWDRGTPLLTLRLLADSGEIAGQVSLKSGEEGMLGPYRVRVLRVVKWTQITFVDIAGMPLVFAGFLIIIMGASLQYFTPPREIFVRREGDVCLLIWRATRFDRFYQDEFAEILDSLRSMEG